MRGLDARSGSAVLCPTCYMEFAKLNYSMNTARQVATLTLLPGAALVLIVLFVSQAASTSMTLLVSLVVGAGLCLGGGLVANEKSRFLEQRRAKTFGLLCQAITGVPSGSLRDGGEHQIENLVVHGGTPWLYSSRNQVVPVPVAVLVHSDNPIDSLSIEELKEVFAACPGNTWERFGWDNTQLVTIAPKEPCRETAVFRRVVLGGAGLSPREWAPASLVVGPMVEERRGGVGFALYSHCDGWRTFRVKRVKVDGQACSWENTDHPLWATAGDWLGFLDASVTHAPCTPGMVTSTACGGQTPCAPGMVICAACGEQTPETTAEISGGICLQCYMKSREKSQDKVPCAACGSMILPSTAEKTSGLCMRCSRKRRLVLWKWVAGALFSDGGDWGKPRASI